LTRPQGRVRIAGSAFENVPAVVRERGDLRTRAIVDLLPVPLPHVADVQVAVGAVEREPPWIAQAEPDGLPGCTAAKRIDAQQLAEPLAQALGAIARISCRAAVAHAEVQKPVAIELELA